MQAWPCLGMGFASKHCFPNLLFPAAGVLVWDLSEDSERRTCAPHVTRVDTNGPVKFW